MSAQPIPSAWRQAVCSHLRARTANRVTILPSCLTRWADDFPGATVPELLLDFEDMLALTLHGCLVSMDPPPVGETWEFWFMHREQKTYGKILLRADNRGIVIYSAHLPDRRHLRCEQTSP